MTLIHTLDERVRIDGRRRSRARSESSSGVSGQPNAYSAALRARLGPAVDIERVHERGPLSVCGVRFFLAGAMRCNNDQWTGPTLYEGGDGQTIRRAGREASRVHRRAAGVLRGGGGEYCALNRTDFGWMSLICIAFTMLAHNLKDRSQHGARRLRVAQQHAQSWSMTVAKGQECRRMALARDSLHQIAAAALRYSHFPSR